MIGVGIGVAPFAANSIAVLGQKSFISGSAQGMTRVLAALGAMIGASGVGFLQKSPLIGASRAMPAVVMAGLILEVLVTSALLSR